MTPLKLRLSMDGGDPSTHFLNTEIAALVCFDCFLSVTSYGTPLGGHGADIHRIFVLQKELFARFTSSDLVSVEANLKKMDP
ncbi:hypothetical protein EVAR_74281_1 [Eumeta japonica]|uniref:Uncharacterized protein n=1 Tax=Eumeta variegata TaxID=151549 RepID=A0A4C1SCU0_EUMVA|nr:hypothetical protein EVAR_74281_1 [Eumeta japonica]